MGKYIQLTTAIPGPKTKALLARRHASVPKGVGNNTPIFAKRAHGALVEDVDGNIFLDFAGAIGSLNVGHTPAKIVQAIQQQATNLIHSSFHVAMYEPYIQLAEKLAAITPGAFEKKTILLNSGAEAVENAVKIARKYTGKTGIVSFARGFHGRTLLGMSLTSKVKPYKFKMGPFAPAIYKAPYPNMFHRPTGMTEEDYSTYCIQQFQDFLHTEVAPEEIAAIVIELVQGEGGFIIPPKSFIQEIVAICRELDILVIVDEIQTGFGRTGQLFASTYFGIEPDMITMSKSLAAGVPISAVTGRATIMDAPNPGELGGTYGGSPLGCVAALATIEQLEQEHLPERANDIGQQISKHFQDLQQEYPVIADVRGLGAMCAIEFIEEDTQTPAKELVASITKKCYESGVIVISAGIYGNIIRFLPPLVITDEQLAEGLEIISKIIRENRKSMK